MISRHHRREIAISHSLTCIFDQLFMSTLANEALLENIYDEVWEEFRISNKLTDDQLNELCFANESGTLLAIETETNKRFENLSR